MKKKRIIIVLLVIVLFLAISTPLLIWGNSALTVTEFTICDDEIPESFSGLRIAQISDLHDAELGEDNGELVALVMDAQPDIIVITGDFIDRKRTDVELSLSLAEKLVDIAPTYFVTGNHEAALDFLVYSELKSGLTELGVTVLENEVEALERNGDRIALMGVQDPNALKDWSSITDEIDTDPEIDFKIMNESLDDLMDEIEGYTYSILLSHRPEVFDVYVDHEIDLVISGHLHGGQIRLPFIGGFYTPNQGLFPRFVDGLYSEGKTNMIISRGLGNSSFPLRVNNRPEVVIITLHSK